MEQQVRRPPIPEQGLYRFDYEHDACGVGVVANLNGVVANLNGVPWHRIVEMGMTVLKRLMHRGASGGDPDTGDGAGLLMTIPDRFFRSVMENLPEPGAYGVAMIFGGVGRESEIDRIVGAEGGRVIGWRDVPVCPEGIGRAARECAPAIRQLFVAGAKNESGAALERRLFLIRRVIEKQLPEAYFCSFSCRTIVYKGLLLATQLERFYPDLADGRFARR